MGLILRGNIWWVQLQSNYERIRVSTGTSNLRLARQVEAQRLRELTRKKRKKRLVLRPDQASPGEIAGVVDWVEGLDGASRDTLLGLLQPVGATLDSSELERLEKKLQVDKAPTAWSDQPTHSEIIEEIRDIKRNPVDPTPFKSLPTTENISAKTTISDLKALWAKDRAQKKTIKRDMTRFQEIIDFFGKSKPLVEITPDLIDRLQSHLIKSRQITSATVNRYSSLLRAALNLAYKRRLIAHVPHITIAKEKPKKTRICTLQEYRALKKAASPEMAKLILLGYETGMRSAEILSLTPDQLNLADKNPHIQLEETKNGDARAVPLTKPCVTALKNFNGWTQYSNSDKVAKHFRKLCAQLQIPDLTFHDLRATFVTRMLKSGLPTATVAKLSGHKSITVLEQRYARFGVADLAEQRKKAEK